MFTKVKKLPSAQELKEKFPASANKLTLDLAIKNILEGRDSRRLLIVGPCSLESEGGIYAYLDKLVDLQKNVQTKLLIIPRLYTAKPRSRDGFRGLMHSPVCDDDFFNGLILCRKILSAAQNNYGFAIADELLYCDIFPYFDDLISYAAIGARTALSQGHRFFASGLDIAVGCKNTLDGNLSALADSIYVARKGWDFAFDGYEVTTNGNPYAHAVLRGYSSGGKYFSNYDKQSVDILDSELSALGHKNVPIIIDASHANSGRDYMRQQLVLKNIAKYLSDSHYASHIKGFMLESYINAGSGTVRGCGTSITDGCMDFDSTVRCVEDLCNHM